MSWLKDPFVLWLGMNGREEEQDLHLWVLLCSHIDSSQTKHFHPCVHLKMFH